MSLVKQKSNIKGCATRGKISNKMGNKNFECKINMIVSDFEKKIEQAKLLCCVAL